MLLSPKSYASLEAHVLQCAFASVATPTAPQVGEVDAFVRKWVKMAYSARQLQACIDKCVFEGYLEVEKKKWGKGTRRTYRITQKGAFHLMTRAESLHPQIKKGMEALISRVMEGANAALMQWFEQGAQHA